jgi:hypothetical protein
MGVTMKLARHGLGVEIPHGWDARIYRRAADQAGSTTRAVMHAANFALPEQREDYGGGAVEIMRTGDVLLMLLEFDPEAAATPLFAHQGLPRRLSPSAFAPNRLQRILPGQAGAQFFFSDAGRAWCLYVVLGSWAARARLAAQAERILASTSLERLAGPAPGEAAP